MQYYTNIKVPKFAKEQIRKRDFCQVFKFSLRMPHHSTQFQSHLFLVQLLPAAHSGVPGEQLRAPIPATHVEMLGEPCRFPFTVRPSCGCHQHLRSEQVEKDPCLFPCVCMCLFSFQIRGKIILKNIQKLLDFNFPGLTPVAI